jgi:hypothetical protein
MGGSLLRVLKVVRQMDWTAHISVRYLQACSWFNPSKRYANARLAARAQRYVNEYRKVFPHDDVGFSFTKSPEKKTFFSKATIGSVSL